MFNMIKLSLGFLAKYHLGPGPPKNVASENGIVTLQVSLYLMALLHV